LNTESETFKSLTSTDSTIQYSTITSYSAFETSTASVLCTTLGAAPGLGRNRNACVCTAESTTVTLPMQVITSDDSRLITCNHQTIPSTWSTISTSTAVWTDTANCQVCSQAGIAMKKGRKGHEGDKSKCLVLIRHRHCFSSYNKRRMR
jgi:hypothetical protein